MYLHHWSMSSMKTEKVSQFEHITNKLRVTNYASVSHSDKGLPLGFIWPRSSPPLNSPFYGSCVFLQFLLACCMSLNLCLSEVGIL